MRGGAAAASEVAMRGLLAFFTVYPSKSSTLEEAARAIYLLPLVGILTGFPGSLFALGGYIIPAGVSASLALGAVLFAAGLHHADGVLDTGDALMVRGEPARRREVLHDARIGIGGLFALFVVYGPALAALGALVASSPVKAALSLLAAEVAGRASMLYLMVFGEPAERTSSVTPFVHSLKEPGRRFMAAGLAVVLPPLLALPLGGAAPLAVLLWVPASALALRVANRAFGGIGGDAVGAAGELSRMVVLVVLSLGL